MRHPVGINNALIAPVIWSEEVWLFPESGGAPLTGDASWIALLQDRKGRRGGHRNRDFIPGTGSGDLPDDRRMARFIPHV
jgi:hypothetical protein